jgi:D-serine deaminase-like pyridoxal phosphate-dependent protein
MSYLTNYATRRLYAAGEGDGVRVDLKRLLNLEGFTAPRRSARSSRTRRAAAGSVSRPSRRSGSASATART